MPDLRPEDFMSIGKTANRLFRNPFKGMFNGFGRVARALGRFFNKLLLVVFGGVLGYALAWYLITKPDLGF